MNITFAEQYGTPCIEVGPQDTFEGVESAARASAATYHDGEDECLVLRFPGRPPELYTVEAAKRSIRPDLDRQE